MLGAGCATGDSSAPREADTHAAFARIQAEEARIADAERRLRGRGSEAEASCPEHCSLLAQSCAAAGAICDMATSHPERDAQTRCARADEVCKQQRRELHACECANGAGQDERSGAQRVHEPPAP